MKIMHYDFLAILKNLIVNDFPSSKLSPSKGLYQGDPLSPFLFIISSEGLSSINNKATSLGLYKGWVILDKLIGIDYVSIRHL